MFILNIHHESLTEIYKNTIYILLYIHLFYLDVFRDHTKDSSSALTPSNLWSLNRPSLPNLGGALTERMLNLAFQNGESLEIFSCDLRKEFRKEELRFGWGKIINGRFIWRCLWRFMEIYGDLWRFMEIYGDLWRFMEIYGDLWRFMEIYGDLWRFMEIYGDLWRFMEIYGDLWRFMEIYGDLWRFMEIYGDLWRFMEIYGDLWRFMEIYRFYRLGKIHL